MLNYVECGAVQNVQGRDTVFIVLLRYILLLYRITFPDVLDLKEFVTSAAPAACKYWYLQQEIYQSITETPVVHFSFR